VPGRFYTDFAEWWPLLSSPDDYEEEAAFYLSELRGACAGEPRSLLELGSGGGNNASHMKGAFAEVVLVDLSAGMLEVSRALNPECAHVQGDMRTVRLGRTFDCVFVHDAVAYMATEADLRDAISTAFAHCRPGGAALFAPDALRETFRETTDHGGHDGGGRALRYLEWVHAPDFENRTYLADYAFLLRERGGAVQVVHDQDVEGLFARAEWLQFLAEAGFEARSVPFDHSELEPGTYEVFVATRPARADPPGR
jgi:SAM-dependent methyltransferase